MPGHRTARSGIKKIPAAYLPFAVFPVKTQRQTGLAFSRDRSVHKQGHGVQQILFSGRSPKNTDATVWLDAASKKGLGSGLEYRFKLAEDTRGKLYGYAATEKDQYFDDEYNDVRDQAGNSGSI
ncbi:MAG: hypothetical protein MZU95_03055 [Desulfomicrobium escambiense]|nr:hypothetical protein [Desulfomicrobium escambiense]